MRLIGRLLIFMLLALLCASRWMHPEGIKHTYGSAYENFRQMAMIRRLFMLPLARDVVQLTLRSLNSSKC
jgi:hypothetical protein